MNARSSPSRTYFGNPGNSFPCPVRSCPGKLRDEFQNDNNHNHYTNFNAATSAAFVSVDAAGPDYLVAEQQPIAGPSRLRASNFDLYAARSERIERFPAHGLKSHE